MSEYKKYIFMENVLNEITGTFVSLDNEDIRRNNQILQEVMVKVEKKLKETNALFKALFQTTFYGGSFYDGLKICKPDEYDLDLLLKIPRSLRPTISQCYVDGFVQARIEDLQALDRQPTLKDKFQGIEKLCDLTILSTTKVSQWMQSTLTRALECFLEGGKHPIIRLSNYTVTVIVSKSGPAFTLKIRGDNDEDIKMDIDLVPCFVFGAEHWPEGFRRNTKNEAGFFIVPKYPDGYTDIWRLSFQEQERDLIKNKIRLKNCLRLLKKLRDTQQHCLIASYYLKTMVLWETQSRPDDFWNKPLSYVFMTLLQSYSDCLSSHRISYFWNENFNLIGKIGTETIDNFSNRIKLIIRRVERNPTNPNVIVEYLLTAEEQKKMKFNDNESDSSTSDSNLNVSNDLHRYENNPNTSTSTTLSAVTAEEQKKMKFNDNESDSSTSDSNSDVSSDLHRYENNSNTSTGTLSPGEISGLVIGITAAVVGGAFLLQRFLTRERRNND